jgi:DnaK suppressor protein
MHKSKIKKFKEMFLEQKERLLAEEAKAEKTEIEVSGDETDMVQANILGAAAEAIYNRRLEQIKKIDRALQRIADGVFGECQECGEDVEEKRLYARPEASTCISCAEKLERLKKQFAR